MYDGISYNTSLLIGVLKWKWKRLLSRSARVQLDRMYAHIIILGLDYSISLIVLRISSFSQRTILQNSCDTLRFLILYRQEI